MTDVQIKTALNGPFLVAGPISLIDAEGKAFDVAGKEKIALCRCGASANKPFCDGAHKNSGFVGDQKAPSA